MSERIGSYHFVSKREILENFLDQMRLTNRGVRSRSHLGVNAALSVRECISILILTSPHASTERIHGRSTGAMRPCMNLKQIQFQLIYILVYHYLSLKFYFWNPIPTPAAVIFTLDYTIDSGRLHLTSKNTVC